MSKTGKQIIDSVFAIADKFLRSDEDRKDEDWMWSKLNDIAAQLKIAQYQKTNVLDWTWLNEGGLIPFHKVNKADDSSITHCGCDIGKAFIPQTISFVNKDGNQDLGIFSLISACGKTTYYPSRMSMWSYVPEGHSNNMFGSYFRINTSLYTKNYNEKLRLIAFFHDPTDGKLIDSTPIVSGAIATGTVYLVRFGTIIYNGFPYTNGTTFTGVVGATTFTGVGNVYLNSQVRAYRDTDPYPASADMIRDIELEILTKELGIEMKAVTDMRNDNRDDTAKPQGQ